MKIIGITGKSGSGKSTLAKELTEKMQDAMCINVDKIGHKATNDVEITKKIMQSLWKTNIRKRRKNRQKKIRKYSIF